MPNVQQAQTYSYDDYLNLKQQIKQLKQMIKGLRNEINSDVEAMKSDPTVSLDLGTKRSVFKNLKV